MQENLTAREQEILNLLLEDNSVKEIAFKLNITNRTVAFHKTNIYQKLDVHNYKELKNKLLPENNLQQLPNETQLTDKINKIDKKLKVLISAGIFGFIFVVSVLILLWNNSYNAAAENLTPNIITLADGTSFFIRTFDTIHLRVNKHITAQNIVHTYNSYSDIFLSDIYNGDIRNIVPHSGSYNKWLKLRLSGTIDKELDNVQIDFQLLEPDGTWHHLAGGGNQRFSKIGPGDFSEIFYIQAWPENREILNQDELPKGEIILVITKVLQNIWIDRWYFYDSEIPDDVPNGTIMATINNLKIEPIF